MSKGFKRLLVFLAVISAAAAGAYYFFNKIKTDDAFDDFDDFEEDEFEDDLEEDAFGRSYVSLTPPAEEKTKEAAAADISEPQTETIEEFFDEEDA